MEQEKLKLILRKVMKELGINFLLVILGYAVINILGLAMWGGFLNRGDYSEAFFAALVPTMIRYVYKFIKWLYS